MANSVDPHQIAPQEQSDLGLLCLYLSQNVELMLQPEQTLTDTIKCWILGYHF